MKFKKKILENGLRVVAVPMKDNPTVTVLVMVEAGSKYETKNINGLSHFLEHMMFKGTTKRPKGIMIARELDSLGAQYNAFTGQEYTGYYAKGQAKYFDKFLDIVSDIYLHPTFPEAEMEREKGVILDEINMYEDLPMRKVYDNWMELLYGNQPAGWTILGPKENIEKMKRKDFIRYHDEHYVAEATTVIVAGNVSYGEIFRKVSAAFSTASKKKKHAKKRVKESQRKPQVSLQYKKTDQAHIMLGVRTAGMKNKDRVALKVLAGILGAGMSSRLFEKLREQMGVGYYVRCGHDVYTDHGYLVAATGVVPARAKEVVTAVLNEFKMLSQESVDERELKKVKDALIGNMMLELEASDDVAEYYGFQEVLREELTKPAEAAKKIRAVTAKDILRVARKMFVNERLNLAVIGPFRETKAFEKILKL